VSLSALSAGLQANWHEGRGTLSYAEILSLPYQRPFLLHYALVFGLGALGALATWRWQRQARAQLTPLLATASILLLLTLRRPLWHYFFVFHWLFSAAAAYGLTLALRRWGGGRPDRTAAAAGVLTIALCNAWQYPDLVSTYRRYLEAYRQRAALVREHPAWVPAPWEMPLADLAVTRGADAVLPFYSGRPLQATLERQRAEEDRQRGVEGAGATPLDERQRSR
jgi:hypothetical protein